MSIGDQIKKRREELGMSQQDLAKKIGVTQGAVGNYETGVSKPKMELLPKLFEALKTDANYIFCRDSEQGDPGLSSQEHTMVRQYRGLDAHGRKIVDFVLAAESARVQELRQNTMATPKLCTLYYSEYKASAGTGTMLDEYERFDQIDVIDTPEARRADYGLMVSGGSMEPVYHDGDIVLVEQADTIEEGEIGIFVVNNEGFIKKLGRDRLISLNPMYRDILLHEYDSIKCCGRVIGTAERAHRQEGVS